MSDIKTEKLRKTTKKAPKKETKRVAEGTPAVDGNSPQTVFADILARLNELGVGISFLRDRAQSEPDNLTNKEIEEALLKLTEIVAQKHAELMEAVNNDQSNSTVVIEQIHTLISDISEHVKSGNSIGAERDKEVQESLQQLVGLLQNFTAQTLEALNKQVAYMESLIQRVNNHQDILTDRLTRMEIELNESAIRSKAIEQSLGELPRKLAVSAPEPVKSNGAAQVAWLIAGVVIGAAIIWAIQNIVV